MMVVYRYYKGRCAKAQGGTQGPPEHDAVSHTAI